MCTYHFQESTYMAFILEIILQAEQWKTFGPENVFHMQY